MKYAVMMQSFVLNDVLDITGISDSRLCVCDSIQSAWIVCDSVNADKSRNDEGHVIRTFYVKEVE